VLRTPFFRISLQPNGVWDLATPTITAKMAPAARADMRQQGCPLYVMLVIVKERVG
jgi:hypothetical protein